jgi:hypothetical protein
MIDYRTVTDHQPRGHIPCRHDWQPMDGKHDMRCHRCQSLGRLRHGRLEFLDWEHFARRPENRDQ